jgi:hypothetical protein
MTWAPRFECHLEPILAASTIRVPRGSASFNPVASWYLLTLSRCSAPFQVLNPSRVMGWHTFSHPPSIIAVKSPVPPPWFLAILLALISLTLSFVYTYSLGTPCNWNSLRIVGSSIMEVIGNPLEGTSPLNFPHFSNWLRNLSKLWFSRRHWFLILLFFSFFSLHQFTPMDRPDPRVLHIILVTSVINWQHVFMFPEKY